MTRLLKWIDHIGERFLWVAQVVILGSIAIVAWYTLDRKPPFAVVSVEPAFARPGEYVTIKAEVRRDVNRHCSAEFSRYVFDALNTRFDLGTQLASPEMIERADQASPNTLRVSFLVPPTIATGPARLDTVLQYRCNRVHYIWPIEVTTRMPFEVLAP